MHFGRGRDWSSNSTDTSSIAAAERSNATASGTWTSTWLATASCGFPPGGSTASAPRSLRLCGPCSPLRAMAHAASCNLPPVGTRRFEAVYGESKRGPVIEIPFDVRQVFGKARAPVRARVNGYKFRSTIAVYGGNYLLGLNKQVRQAAGVAPGDRVAVELELDTQDRTVQVPKDLAEAMEEAGGRAAFDSLSLTHRREHAYAVTGAQKPGTPQGPLGPGSAGSGPGEQRR